MSRAHISSNIMSRMRVFESTDSSSAESPKRPIQHQTATGPYADHRLRPTANAVNRTELSEIENGRTTTSMMMSSSPPPPGVQTDAEGLILPKKLINPCLESSDRKQLHRELKFNSKMGISVLNQKSELQRAYEKQRERQQLHQQQQLQTQEPLSPIAGGLKGELSRVIMERAQKHERAHQDTANQDDDTEDRQYVNPEYLNVRAKLRTGQRGDIK